MIIKFFESHFPSRIILLFFLFAIIAGVFFQFHTPTQSLLLHKWILIGQKINEGNLMYSQIWDNTGPLFIYSQSLITGIFGTSIYGNLFFGLILIFIQSVIISAVINRLKLFSIRSYIPSLIFITLHFAEPHLCFYSPQLLGTTFILLLFSNLLTINLISGKLLNYKVFQMGIYLGLASLSHLSLTFFAVFILFSILSFSTLDIKVFLNLIFGFALPYILISLLFYSLGNLGMFYELFVLKSVSYFDGFSIRSIIPIIPLIVFTLISFVGMAFDKKQVQFDIKVRNMLAFWLIGSLILLLGNSNQINIYIMEIAALPIAYFISALLINIKKQIYKELIYSFILAFPLVFHLSYNSNLHTDLSYNESSKTVLKLGKKLNEYSKNEKPSSFVNYKITNQIFENPEKNIGKIMICFSADYPNTVVDNTKGDFEKVYSITPILRNKYIKKSSKTYVLR